MWTLFWDMHSGGSTKEPPYDKIIIEAPEEEAKIIFFNRFRHNPERVTCACCGEDYSISHHEDLAQLTGFHRGCRHLKSPRYKRGSKKGLYNNEHPVIKKHLYLEDGEDPPKGFEVDDTLRPFKKYMTVEQYVEREDVLVIPSEKISESERVGSVPEQGYVWVD